MMSSWTSFTTAMMINHLWQGLLLVAAIALLLHWRRRDSAAIRHSIWLLATIALLAMPLLVLLPTTTDQAIANQPNIERNNNVEEPETTLILSQSPRPLAVPSRQWHWSSIGALIWVSIASWQLALLIQAYFRARATRATANACEPSIQRLADRLGTRLKLIGVVPVCWSNEIESPQTNGTLRPLVLLPAAWRGSDIRNDLLEHALAHELAHIKRRDHHVVWLQFTARILVGFNPALWVVINQLNHERESACDDWALQLGCLPRDYASSLVTVAESLITKPTSELAIPCLRSRHHLRRRITNMLDRKKKHTTRSIGLVITFVAICTAAGAVVAAPFWPTLNALLPAAHSERSPRAGDGLLFAAWEGDLTQARRLIEAGAEIDAVHSGRDPRTALIAAARRQQWEVLQLLLDSGADVNFHARGDEPVLMTVAQHGNAELVDELLARGAIANQKSRGNGTPLIAAARGGDIATVNRLLEAGVDPDTFVRGDEAPMFHAIVRGHTEVVRALLQAGASPSKSYRGDGTPLMLAIRHGHSQIADLLLEAGAAVDVTAKGDGTALIDAARRNDVNLAQRLIDAGAEVNQAVKGDGNALINAARRGHYEVAELLLQQGADVNGKVRGDDTPLINAVWSGRTELVQLLLDNDADPNLKGDFDRRLGVIRTPLNQAGSNGSMVELLEAAGATQ